MIKKAVILAGGKGTRMLPYTKACAKEMLPICDKPALHYIVDDAARGGINEILIIINPEKNDIIRYFSFDAALEKGLSEQNKTYLLDDLKRLTEKVKISYAVQKTADGTGGAMLLAEEFAAGEPILVMNGDDLMRAEIPVSAQLMGCYDRHGKAVAAVSAVSDEEMKNCGSVRVLESNGRELKIDAIIEKPKEGEAYGNFATQGWYVFPTKIFEVLRRTDRVNGELRLTDALGTLAKEEGAFAYDFEGARYDLGSKAGYLQAEIEYSLADPKLHDDVIKILSIYGGTK